MILVGGCGGPVPSVAEREALGAARSLSATRGDEVVFAALAAATDGLGDSIDSHPADRVVMVSDADVHGGSTSLVDGLASIAAELRPGVIVVAGDDRGLEVGPRVAQRLDGTSVTHAVAVHVDDDRPVWTRPVFGGKALATVRARREPVVVSVRPGAFPPAEDEGAAPVQGWPAPLGHDAVELVERRAKEDSWAALDGAQVVVSGGRGLGSAEAFAELEELARALGGSVGASLAAVDEGWASPEQQIGLTGRVVKPELYFAVGISGASQHLAGMSDAKTVVAINTDPDAPIFDAADLGVVIDHRQLLPAVIEECRKRSR